MNPEAFFTLYSDLPQFGPGSAACTLEALKRLPTLPPSPRVVDVGCGSGRQTLVLAEALRTRILAVDLHQPYLDQLERDARARRLDAFIETRQADMAALDVPAGSVDLLWSEGAIYHLGFGPGLRRFRPLLAPGGLAAVTECTWLTDARPAEAARFWTEGYPTMGTTPENRATAEAEGYEVLDTFTLPHSAWWDYYTPLLQRMERLRPTAAPALREVFTATEEEIALFRRHGDSYGYVFYLLRNRNT
ncbi:class I SAM-dependent methyltransferase [Pyxidicoccus sp. MSG2]|uniref:class I SAM-dependent methyltransferase n=1 Tax=Pyxidicoccus sp. MSG2 TaxID=2996790 RepID=UPI0022721B6C|nr:class I SAM-dependent methyltransferase [Pyxidicoccus sp. MSG2]MCY1018073.1 class I SAM-dependent methyltransferase [Pyxidicoccus sp. MSG2]